MLKVDSLQKRQGSTDCGIQNYFTIKSSLDYKTDLPLIVSLLHIKEDVGHQYLHVLFKAYCKYKCFMCVFFLGTKWSKEGWTQTEIKIFYSILYFPPSFSSSISIIGNPWTVLRKRKHSFSKKLISNRAYLYIIKLPRMVAIVLTV